MAFWSKPDLLQRHKQDQTNTYPFIDQEQMGSGKRYLLYCINEDNHFVMMWLWVHYFQIPRIVFNHWLINHFIIFSLKVFGSVSWASAMFLFQLWQHQWSMPDEQRHKASRGRFARNANVHLLRVNCNTSGIQVCLYIFMKPLLKALDKPSNESK